MASSSITYQFHCHDQQYQCVVPLDEEPNTPDENNTAPLASWTELHFHQCEGCKWQKDDRCPVASRLQEPVTLLDKLYSYEEVDVTVITPERTYSKTCSIQESLSGLFGLIMARSGCPAFEPFRGLAKFHLPFASYEETLFRIVSSYLFRQHLLQTPPQSKEETIAAIQGIYEDVHKVNTGIFNRLREGAAPTCDSPFNALTILDSMGRMVVMSVEDGIEELSQYFT